MAIRSHSAPLGGPDGAGADVNPLQGELRLQALRPRELPGDGALPAGDAGCLRLAGKANGKGRGDGTVMFTTPSSWEEAGRPVTMALLEETNKMVCSLRGNCLGNL